MAGASINRLPNEIHREILKALFSLSIKPMSVHTDKDIYNAPPVEWEEKNARLRTNFPFNAANVCKLWYDIVTRIPKCWNRIVFDVRRDPTPFLDAFSWSDYPETLEVVVFSSATEFKMVDRKREARRVAAITKALHPHLHRCKSVIFEVAYSSSLPLPSGFFEEYAPDLKKLSLGCNMAVDDSQRCSDAWANPTTSDAEYLYLSQDFPMLVELSLTGFCFMYLALHHPNWLQDVRMGGSNLHLSISSFEFVDRGFFTLPTFVHYLSQMHGRLNSLSLSDLCLSYEHEDEPRRRGAAVHKISCPRINFKNVCDGFLSQFYSLVNVTARECQSFTDCEIPIIRQKQRGRVLLLKNIEDSSNGPSEERGTGLRNILEVWSGSELKIRSCKAFDDTLLDWLKPGVKSVSNDPFGAHHSVAISSLCVRDCENFTSRGMREFIDAQNKFSEAEDENDSDSDESDGERIRLRYLTVTGKCPEITQEDRDFYGAKSAGLTLTWKSTQVSVHEPEKV
ncbi:hypothetical protein GALMADRAFT_252682 [Galerina marginata CBS 339.88]|uniref:F-box domain-containing protein n=1 Tax=Galerina marginata (strain CBS 339.88) TaxID=685588 RepID=A0A067SR98_GALM3|nr:hypothetical protein GALMADRAFT_252682 [Galerina marginata CBS 339.88]